MMDVSEVADEKLWQWLRAVYQAIAGYLGNSTEG